MGAFFALVKILGRSQTASLVSHPKIFTNTKLPPQILELFVKADSAIRIKNAESSANNPSLRVSEASVAIQNFAIAKMIKINRAKHQNLARFVVQKIGSKVQVSATADFLLEAEKRGSPPKSEKAAAFWRVGGAGRGVQPFLREKTSEFNAENGENIADSANRTKIAESRPKSQNLRKFVKKSA
ncbi:hypothetical protein ACWIUD_07170 [Helicobacter sp. 23-1044]